MALKILKLNRQDVIQKKEEKKWNELIKAVMDGKVIPVIGADFLVDKEDDNDGNLHQQIIDTIANTYELKSKPESFSQLVYDEDYLKKNNNDEESIYININLIINGAIEQKLLSPNKLMLRLLKLGKFPFVITTSFTPMVEIAMKEVWGEDNVRVLQFSKDPKFNNTVGQGDIQNELDMKQPTVYYMFGKHSDYSNYVVTDMEMMEFCRKWIAGGANVPRVLTEVIKKRYLLILGNNYSDWLFRFIWYSMRSTAETMRLSMMVNHTIEPSLQMFLDHLQTFIEKDPEYVVTQIEKRVKEAEKEKIGQNAGPDIETDVFLSYSHSDKEIVTKMYKALSGVGLRVWFDDNSIPKGDDWKKKYLEGISKSRLFIPILSCNVEKEYMQEHEYREEWKRAAEKSGKMGGRIFIFPMAEEGFNFYKETTKLPKAFIEKNAYRYTIADDFQEFAENVKQKVEEIKQQEEDVKNG